jgi:hypothetical protein
MLLKKHEYYFQYPASPLFRAGFTGPGLSGDLPEDMRLIFPDKGIIFMNQEHGNKVLTPEKPGVYDCDGIITDKDNMVLTVKTADCLPLILYNEKEKITGVVHMGWRSAAKGILPEINMDLKDYTVIAGPGLRKCCYEVKENFTGYKALKKYITRKGNSLYFDPVGLAKHQLIALGLKEENFLDTEICSFCCELALPSYRKTKTGNRTLSFITFPA